jgi:hypothetical protein
MMTHRPPRLGLAILLAASASPLLGARIPGTAPPRAASAHRTTAASSAPSAQIWNHLTRLWAAIGCIADPNGAKCAAGTTVTPPAVTQPPSSDIGCIADPNG